MRQDQYNRMFKNVRGNGGGGAPSKMRNSTDNLNALDIGAGWVTYQTLPARTWPAPPLFDVSVWLLVSAPVAACRAPAWSQRAVGPVRDRGKQSLLASSTLEATPSC